MLKHVIRITAASFVIVCAGQSAQAHHSFSSTFQEDAKISVQGVVTKFTFKNPHILVYYDVAGEDGQVTSWVSEGAAATLMRRSGWDKNILKPGDIIRVTGDSTHDGSPMTSIDSIDVLEPGTLNVARVLSRGRGDDEALEYTTEVAEIEPGIPNVSGAWARNAGDERNSRPQRPNLDMTEIGAVERDNFDLATDPQVFCDPPGLVRQAGTTPHPFSVEQFDDRVVIDYEEYGGHREIYFDPPSRSPVKTHLGNSIARYEGDALIIETTGLLRNLASPEGNWLSDETTTVETFKRADNDTDGAVLSYEMVVTDPVNLKTPLVQTKQKALVDDYEMIGNECYPPLRERTAVSPYITFFVPSEGLGADVEADQAAADAKCEALAETVGSGGRSWKAVFDPMDAAALETAGPGPWYNASGVPVAVDAAALKSGIATVSQASLLTERASATDASVGAMAGTGQFLCFAAEPIASTVIKSAAADVALPTSSATPAGSDKKSGGNGFLFGVLGVLVLFIAGGFLFMKSRAKP